MVSVYILQDIHLKMCLEQIKKAELVSIHFIQMHLLKRKKETEKDLSTKSPCKLSVANDLRNLYLGDSQNFPSQGTFLKSRLRLFEPPEVWQRQRKRLFLFSGNTSFSTSQPG